MAEEPRPRPGDPWPKGFGPREWLALNQGNLEGFEPRIGQYNVYGIFGDKRGFPIRGRHWAQFSEDLLRPTRGIPLSQFELPRRQQLTPFVNPTPDMDFPKFKPSTFKGDIYGLMGDQANFVPAPLRKNWEGLLRPWPTNQAIPRYAIERLGDMAVFPEQGGQLAALSNRIRPFTPTPATPVAPVAPRRLPMQGNPQAIIEGLPYATGRRVRPGATLPGVVTSLAAPLVISQLPVSRDAKSVLTGAFEGGSLGSLGFALGPQVGIPATALGTLVGGGTALLGL